MLLRHSPSPSLKYEHRPTIQASINVRRRITLRSHNHAHEDVGMPPGAAPTKAAALCNRPEGAQGLLPRVERSRIAGERNSWTAAIVETSPEGAQEITACKLFRRPSGAGDF
jgi:hypothetical protein